MFEQLEEIIKNQVAYRLEQETELNRLRAEYEQNQKAFEANKQALEEAKAADLSNTKPAKNPAPIAQSTSKTHTAKRVRGVPIVDDAFRQAVSEGKSIAYQDSYWLY